MENQTQRLSTAGRCSQHSLSVLQREKSSKLDALNMLLPFYITKCYSEVTAVCLYAVIKLCSILNGTEYTSCKTIPDKPLFEAVV